MPSGSRWFEHRARPGPRVCSCCSPAFTCVLGKRWPWGGFLGGESAHPPASLQISLRRGMQADPGALAALCEKTDNDIRACVNTLQVGRWAGGAGAAAGGGRAQPPLTAPHTLCPVPARAGPAAAERAGRADHSRGSQGPAQGALLRVAGGLPAAPGAEVSRPASPASSRDRMLPRPWGHLASPPSR